MTEKVQVIIDADDKTAKAFNQVKNNLSGLADASKQTTRGFDNFLRLTPQMMLLGGAAAIVGTSLHTIYESNASLQKSAGGLGEAWDKLVLSIGNVLPLEAAGNAMDWITDKVTRLAAYLSGDAALPQTKKEREEAKKFLDDANKKVDEAMAKNDEAIRKQKELRKAKQSAQLELELEGAIKQEQWLNDEYDKRIKLLKEIEKSAASVWEAQLSNEEKLALEYQKNAEIVANALANEVGNKERHYETLLALDAKYNEAWAGLQAEKDKIKQKEIEDDELRRGMQLYNENLAANDRVRIAKDEADRKTQLNWGAAQNIASAFTSLTSIFAGQSRKAFEIHKAFSIAEATINTLQAATKAYAQGGIYGFISAAAIVAAGLAKVHQISSMQPGGGAAISSGGTVPLPQSPIVPNTPQVQSASRQETVVNVYIGDKKLTSMIVEGVVKAVEDDTLVLRNADSYNRIVVAR